MWQHHYDVDNINIIIHYKNKLVGLDDGCERVCVCECVCVK